jgi:hypothetical protein
MRRPGTWLSSFKLLASATLVTGVCLMGAVVRLSPPAVPLARAGEARPDPGISRDWKQAPAIIELDTPEDIYAVGDVHGDYHRLVALLASGKVIAGRPDQPEQVRWSAGKSVLVCTGDLIDKGPHSLKVIALFRALARDAATAKGHVIVLMGNHEADFLHDPDNDDKALEFIRELDKRGVKPRDVAAARDEQGVGEFLNSLPVAARVNDWFFAHAGDTQGLTLKELRSAVEEEVGEKGYKAEILLGEKGLLEARLHKRPWWEKKDDTADKSEARLRRYVEALGVKHLVIGHQPGNVTFADGSSRAKGALVQKFNGLIFLIDVGMSEAIDYSCGALLQIHGGEKPRAVVHYPDKAKETLWPNP